MRRERKQYNKRERKSNTESGKTAIKHHKQHQQSPTTSNNQKDLLNTLVINETQIEMKFENELEQMGLGKSRPGQMRSSIYCLNLKLKCFQVKRTIQILSNNQNGNQLQLKQLLIDHVGKECLLLILWAKTIQNYQTLNLNDQAHLIETNFMEILILNYIWRTCLFSGGATNESFIYFNKTFKLNRQTCKDLNITCIFDSVMQIVKNFMQLRVSVKEYACLKMLVLLKSGECCQVARCSMDFLKSFKIL
jgi:hypothetical protein